MGRGMEEDGSVLETVRKKSGVAVACAEVNLRLATHSAVEDSVRLLC